MVPINGKEIEGTVVKIIKIDAWRVIGIHAGVISKDFFHNAFGFVNFFERSLVGNADIEDASDVGALGDVPDGFVREFTVGYGNQVALEGADAGGA